MNQKIKVQLQLTKALQSNESQRMASVELDLLEKASKKKALLNREYSSCLLVSTIREASLFLRCPWRK